MLAPASSTGINQSDERGCSECLQKMGLDLTLLGRQLMNKLVLVQRQSWW